MTASGINIVVYARFRWAPSTSGLYSTSTPGSFLNRLRIESTPHRIRKAASLTVNLSGGGGAAIRTDRTGLRPGGADTDTGTGSKYGLSCIQIASICSSWSGMKAASSMSTFAWASIIA